MDVRSLIGRVQGLAAGGPRRWRRGYRYGKDLLRGYVRTRTWGVRIGKGVTMRGEGTYDLAPGTVIRNDTYVYVGPGATLRMENRTSIGAGSRVNLESGLTLSEGARVSWNVEFMDTDFHHVYRTDGRAMRRTAPIVVGKGCLIGAGAMVMKGVTIGDNSIVGARSVVRRDVPSGTIVAGNPAVPVGTLSHWTP